MKEKIKLGDSASFQKRFTAEEHQAHLKCINDTNPIHFDEDFAATTPFGRPILQGALTSALISGILGTTLPGPDTVYLGQTLKFLLPVFVGEMVTARVSVTGIRADKPILTLKTQCFNEAGILAIDGEAVVKVPTTRLKEQV